MTTRLSADPYGLLIATDRISRTSAGLHSHIYPGTGRPNAAVALAGADEIDRAVSAAKDAQEAWMALTVDQRRDKLIDVADVVHEHLAELAELNTLTTASRFPTQATRS